MNPAVELPANPVWAVALALALDLAVGEPPTRFHPVAWFGRLVAPFDREWRRPGPQFAGLAVAVVLPLLAASAVAAATALAGRLAPWAGVLIAGLALFSATSLRMLYRKAREVALATDSDLPTARERLRWLAGRDAADLSAGEVRSAAVESAAENLADGLVAPLLAFAALAPVSLALAAGAAAWVKAVNTLDSMLGYPHKPHGTASARLDDAVMWLPARASAALVALAALAPGSLVAARRWADAPPSPNSGWPMATLAAAVDARLEKPGVYALNPRAGFPTVETSLAGIRIVGVAGALAYVGSVLFVFGASEVIP
ncbi:adenosylcobinamide-phosphate synthase CbiB [Halorussus vallis]|uniref:adenosylcobinamide-phosphate synthase CbiB n=1 Tax=Halorussus vallis TaxID=2953749 RepID=UPI0020A0AA3C|nr:adenosylcobinamide-phosphate synthase CbiB [Halorussus vallis]USZ77725.1 adenosylcobinamide-phosphate synthase CbiB [Halorussus vallis]